MLKSLLKKLQFKKDSNSPTKKSISSLAPKILTEEKDIARVEPYLTAIKNALDENAITNIAITGAYGSGKSTIIKTFQHLNPEYKYLNISLASFNDSNDNDDLERLLEVSILQQIFYHVKPTDIPDSRFKRIVNNTAGKIWLIATGLVLWISSIFILFKYDYINKINPDNWIWGLKNIDWLALFVFSVFFTGIGFFSKTVVRLFSNSKINKFNIQGEVELGDNIDKSVFNEHLEEILYFFERTKYNVIVIEDLDRFENTDIFTKLRELNILLNNSNSIQSERKGEKINFVYAIKDDMFKNKNERVKFFEYIIPVIPFINPSNADEQLSKLIKEANLEGLLSKEFIGDVITFIDDIDMRLLINIFHEFVLYRNILNPEFIAGFEELFAIITYKNLYPNDFMKLHKREGMLYQFLNSKTQYIEVLITKLDKAIKKNETEITSIDSERVNSINDLRIIYLNAVLNLIPQNATLSLNLSLDELIEEENFENFIINENITYDIYTIYDSYRYSRTNAKLNFSFEEIGKQINSELKYSEREILILDKAGDKINKLKLEIEKFKNRKLEIKSWDIKQIFEEVDINPYLDGFAGSPLMRNLLLNGYINENYNDYISLFHEVNLTKEDFLFEKKIKSGEYLAFDYRLTNIETLLNKIPEKYFKKDVIFNFDLLDFLGENYEKYQTLYNMVIHVLSNEKEKSIEFIDGYIYRENIPIAIFMQSICKSWDGMIDYLGTKSNYTEEKENYYLELFIKFATIEDIIKFQNKDLLKEMIQEKPYFLSLIRSTEMNYFEKITSLFKKLNVEFDTLNPITDDTKELFNYVYENHHYQINEENIELFIIEYGEGIEGGDLKKANYNTILSSNCGYLISNIEGNINDYVKNVFLKLDENLEEPEDSFTFLLNDIALKNNLKQEIINKYNFSISNLSDIADTEIKTMLIKSNKIIANWYNVIDFYIDCESVIEEPLISFFNKEENYTQLSKEVMSKEGDFEYANFRKEILLCKEISDESYKKLLESSIYTRDELAFENLNIEKVKYLVEKILTLSEKNYDLLKITFPNEHIELIAKYQDKFITDLGTYALDDKSIILLLGLFKINNKTKIEVIKNMEPDKILNNKDIAIIVCSILSESDYISLEFQFLEGIFKNTKSVENRIKLLNIQFDKLSIEEISNLIKTLPYPYSDVGVSRRRPTIPKNEHNTVFIKNLSNKGLISSYEIKNNEIKIVANY
ncbi:hypothetical protein [Chryseobacterium sp.]|uniref:YobI family P-loop NTPase n=1 Tax=Chryseobacterium sp. TaxID=1871047 RepID=UPI000EDB118D|nr:hypothetical protein [Chryseobacterium sp.]HCA08100.1 hypothetical protein [Chryseobacterium sp.]